MDAPFPNFCFIFADYSGCFQATSTKTGAAHFGLPSAVGAGGGDSDLLTQCPVVSEYLKRERSKG